MCLIGSNGLIGIAIADGAAELSARAGLDAVLPVVGVAAGVFVGVVAGVSASACNVARVATLPRLGRGGGVTWVGRSRLRDS